jgi:hypothetical protein
MQYERAAASRAYRGRMVREMSGREDRAGAHDEVLYVIRKPEDRFARVV